MQRTKINWIQILQGWAMLWVVIGHAYMGSDKNPDQWPVYVLTLHRFAYSFHMALFMFTSGFLFYLTRLSDSNNTRWTFQSIIADKTKRLLLPGLVFSLLALLLKVAFPGEMERTVSLGLQDIVHILLFPNDNPLREMWFIVTLFWMFVCVPLWKWCINDNRRVVGVLALLCFLHFVHPSTQFLCLREVCIFAIWFFCGIVVCKTGTVDRMFSANKLLTLTAGILVYTFGAITHPVGQIVGGIILSIGLALLLDRYVPGIFLSFRNYTYQIFLMGIFCQIFVRIMYAHSEIPYLPAYLLSVAMGLYVPVLISKLTIKTRYRPLLYCMGLRPPQGHE